MPSYKTVAHSSEAEHTTQKSRFIARCFQVESEEEAARHIGETKKRYWDATHNCYAYRIGDKGEISRCSDDGEPHGTAGRPILEVLLRQNVTDILCIVTRYFGGVLLGTGGLARAYATACADALLRAGIVQMRECTLLELQADYAAWQTLQTLLRTQGIVDWKADYTENVKCRFWLPTDRVAELAAILRDSLYGLPPFNVIERRMRPV